MRGGPKKGVLLRGMNGKQAFGMGPGKRSKSISPPQPSAHPLSLCPPTLTGSLLLQLLQTGELVSVPYALGLIASLPHIVTLYLLCRDIFVPPRTGLVVSMGGSPTLVVLGV